MRNADQLRIVGWAEVRSPTAADDFSIIVGVRKLTTNLQKE
jgi:hypothetical protein